MSTIQENEHTQETEHVESKVWIGSLSQVFP